MNCIYWGTILRLTVNWTGGWSMKWEVWNEKCKVGSGKHESRVESEKCKIRNPAIACNGINFSEF